ncbi:hypothetical protein HK44_021645 [Pseudomonas fluorescens HK44]|uniref:Uncharacterized protein n=1 Tax=Pseudomonas fluorescens HK44 TaxID=1042209 RepID=A0A010TH06_PSEFL|nr:hypothetical protein HK44_021645 [Pseudomonas fluorescens HK44]
MKWCAQERIEQVVSRNIGGIVMYRGQQPQWTSVEQLEMIQTQAGGCKVARQRVMAIKLPPDQPKKDTMQWAKR